MKSDLGPVSHDRVKSKRIAFVLLLAFFLMAIENISLKQKGSII